MRFIWGISLYAGRIIIGAVVGIIVTRASKGGGYHHHTGTNVPAYKDCTAHAVMG